MAETTFSGVAYLKRRESLSVGLACLNSRDNLSFGWHVILEGTVFSGMAYLKRRDSLQWGSMSRKERQSLTGVANLDSRDTSLTVSFHVILAETVFGWVV